MIPALKRRAISGFDAPPPFEFFKQTGKVIVPLPIQEILDEQIAHTLA